MLSPELKQAIDKAVLCWLATTNTDYEPNVSPKEMFTHLGDETLLVANIASPNSVRNIVQNPKVCVSFVDVFTQKGFKLKGQARIIAKNEPDFAAKAKSLTDLFSDKFPIQALIEIRISSVSRILAPSYVLFPKTTTEQSQIAGAMQTYQVKPA